MSRPLVIAHRGASGEQPENTYPAFERAIELGADMIETDLHLSRDGVIVIHHDAVLARLGERGEIGDRTAAELSALDAAPGTPTIEPIPTLEGLLERFGGRIDFNLELKVGGRGPYPGLEDLAVTSVEARGLMPRMLFSSFDDRVLEALRRSSPGARLAVLVSPRAPRRIFERVDRVGAEAIHPHVALVTDALMAEAHARGLAVYPYTANESAEMTRLLDLGVDGVITNYPARLAELLAARAAGPS